MPPLRSFVWYRELTVQNYAVLKLPAICFGHNFVIRTQNRAVQVLKTTGIGLVYNLTRAESQKASLFSRNRHFCARGLLFNIFRYARLVPLKISSPMHLNLLFSQFLDMELHKSWIFDLSASSAGLWSFSASI